MRLRAPAKINWSLEVLGRREDGYHEVRTVLQTVDLCDEVEVRAETRPAGPPPPQGAGDRPYLALRGGNVRLGFAADEMWPGDGPTPGSGLVSRAADLLDPDWKRLASVDIRKRIPWVAGMGGSSSDAAAALRGLNEVWELGLGGEALAGMAAELGSDVPFFLGGGCALAVGRGERVTPLPDPPPTWLVLLVPPLAIADKTATMYAALTPDDFSDGSTTAALVERMREGDPVEGAALGNAFERVAYERFKGLVAYREALLAAGATSVQVAGAGPALFALAASEAAAREMLARLRSPGGQAFAIRTLSSAEALAEG